MTLTTGIPGPSDTWRMEQFSRAYVQAVASAVGCVAARPEVDDDSVDLTLSRKSTDTTVRSPKLDLQLKATYADCLSDKRVTYPLKVKNYEELRHSNVLVPRILVVVVIPPEIENWMAHDEEKLSLRRCGYWISLRGRDESTNAESVTIYLPRVQLFDMAGLHDIFTRLEAGGEP